MFTCDDCTGATHTVYSQYWLPQCSPSLSLLQVKAKKKKKWAVKVCPQIIVVCHLYSLPVWVFGKL